MSSVNKYPLDPDRLIKGSRVEVAELEQIFGVKRATSPVVYQLKLLALKDWARGQTWASGNPVTLRTDHGALVVCTDEEAATYNRRKGKRHWRGTVSALAHAIAVDVTKLSAEERKRHERTLLVQGRMLAAAKEAKTQLKIEAAKRHAPAMLNGKEPCP